MAASSEEVEDLEEINYYAILNVSKEVKWFCTMQKFFKDIFVYKYRKLLNYSVSVLVKPKLPNW